MSTWQYHGKPCDHNREEIDGKKCRGCPTHENLSSSGVVSSWLLLSSLCVCVSVFVSVSVSVSVFCSGAMSPPRAHPVWLCDAHYLHPQSAEGETTAGQH